MSHRGPRDGEMYVTVIDPQGVTHEVGTRNARDLVEHLGWSYPTAKGAEVNAYAHAPRKKKSIAEVQKQAEAESRDEETTPETVVEAMEKDAPPAVKRGPGRPRKDETAEARDLAEKLGNDE